MYTMQIRAIRIEESLGKPTPGRQLELYLDDITSNRFASSAEYGWWLRDVVINPEVLAALLRILNYGTTKWGRICFENCRLDTQDVALPSWCNEQKCTSDDIRRLVTALATRTLTLEVDSSPNVLEILLEFPQLEINEFWFCQEENVTNVLATRLGNMIQRSVSLRTFCLRLPVHDVPTDLMECLRSATHLQELFWMSFRRSSNPRQTLSEQWFRELLCDRLLRQYHPQSQLRSLTLLSMQLEDCHFIPLAQALPGSQIEYLNVDYNKIQSTGILEFARQLPMIVCLKEVRLFWNPWRNDSQYRDCVAALVKGMMNNYSIEKMMLDHYVKYPDDASTSWHEYQLVWHYTTLNVTGRKILRVSDNKNSVPLGLWPSIFERAGTTPRSPVREIDCERSDREERANALFYFLQNSTSAILSTRRQHSVIQLSAKPRK
jgi:hypothetical protein